MNIPIFKIVVLGQGRVGKTSISLKFVNNEFNDDQQSTINASYLQKKVTLENNQSIKLAIWDTAGQQKYNAIAPVYYRQAMGAIVTYDITSSQSLQKVKKWVLELGEHAPKDIVLSIAGNKADLQHIKKVNTKAVEKYAQSHQASHFLVSAKNGQNVKQLFGELAQRIYKIHMEGKTKNNRLRNNPRLIIDNQSVAKQEEKQKKCCK